MTVAACPACAAAPIAEEAAKTTRPPNIHLSLPTIHCAACIRKIEEALNALPGVEYARVNLSLKRVAITSDTQSPTELATALAEIGYEAHPLDSSVLASTHDAQGRDLLIRLSVAGFAMMNVMLLSVAVWSGAEGATRDLFHLISAAISVPVVLFSGQPFFRSAWTALKTRGLNMDVPISLAILLALGMSLFETLEGGQHAYFDAALSLTFFLLIGRYLDHRTRSAARSAAKELAALETHTAFKLTDGKTVETPVADLNINDKLLIPTGMRIPVDGRLISAKATTDRSFLTGETVAITNTAGEILTAGEINLGAPFEMAATAVGEDTTLRRMSQLVEAAESSRNNYTNLADRAARIYAPAVHLLALFAFAVWLWISGDMRLSLNIAVAVLIITCPCALGLAVPAVVTAAIGRLYSHGFLVKNATALERLSDIDTVVLDKTGTLTLPGLKADLENLTPTEKSVALALSQNSKHPTSQAIAASLSDHSPAALTDIAEIAGSGIQARFEGRKVQLGKGEWLGAEFDATGLRIDGYSAHEIPMTEQLRPGVKTAIDRLKGQGLTPIVLSGDRETSVQLIARELGLANVIAEVSAQDKHDLLQDLQSRGHRVLMVGDGLNDTASLAAAHASLAPSTALDVSRTAADIILLRDSFEDLPKVISVARASTRLSKQNFAIAAIYNLIAVPIALVGLATPLIAAIAMSTSSITVLLNALRVGRAR